MPEYEWTHIPPKTDWNKAYNPLRIFPCCNQNCFGQGIIIFFTNMGVGGIIYEAIQKFIYINKIQTGK